MTEPFLPARKNRRAVEPGDNQPEFSVSELSSAVKHTVEDRFGHVRVRGEISRPSRPRSGHIYLTLKDESANLDAVIWRGVASRLTVQPEEGLEVVATGRLTTYAGQSKYQLVIESLTLAGQGALLKMLDERRRKLAAEGLFAAERKRPLPYLPSVIGVVTSPSGAVIRDILHRLADRFPRHVLVWPVRVQGERSGDEVAAAIQGFNALPTDGAVPRPDVLIIARGGGSLEDLMGFNEEAVVRAAAASDIPLISAVGHETDTTLIDLAADRRAPTPTAAAEMAVPVRAELLASLTGLQARSDQAFARLLSERRERVAARAARLGDPARLLEAWMQRVDERSTRLDRSARLKLERLSSRLTAAGDRLIHPARALAETKRRLGDLDQRLTNAARRRLQQQRQGTAPIFARLRPEGLRRRTLEGGRLLNALQDRGRQAITTRRDRSVQALAAPAALLESLSHKSVLERGFVLVRDEKGGLITRADGARSGQAVSLLFAGEQEVAAVVGPSAVVVGTGATEAASPPPRPRKAPSKPAGGTQGDLF